MKKGKPWGIIYAGREREIQGIDGDCVISEQWKQQVLEQAVRWGRHHHRVACRILQSAADAEDVCQKAYVKAIESRQSIQDPARLGGWLTRTILNESLMIHRQRKRDRQHVSSVWQARPAGMGQQSSPLDELAQREWVMTLLEQLDEPTRTVVILRTMQGMTGEEVRHMLGCSAAIVSRRLHEGLEQLRNWIASQQEVGTP